MGPQRPSRHHVRLLPCSSCLILHSCVLSIPPPNSFPLPPRTVLSSCSPPSLSSPCHLCRKVVVPASAPELVLAPGMACCSLARLPLAILCASRNRAPHRAGRAFRPYAEISPTYDHLNLPTMFGRAGTGFKSKGDG